MVKQGALAAQAAASWLRKAGSRSERVEQLRQACGITYRKETRVIVPHQPDHSVDPSGEHGCPLGNRAADHTPGALRQRCQHQQLASGDQLPDSLRIELPEPM